MPEFLTIGGDGANYDIGFGAMSRVLTGGTPVKMLVLNTGAYSNTGGQASTASYMGQDADLARYGKAHHGKQESRKELALLAAFHPGVFSCVTATALHGHFLQTTFSLLGFQGGAAIMDVYTPCGTENGIPEELSNSRSRLAVESRMSPVFVHDPRKGETLAERFSLDGNPDLDKTWTTSTLEYVDDQGQLQLMTTPLTPAEFALGEVRFKKNFKKLAKELEDGALPIAEFVELDPADRGARVPFVFATDDDKRLIKVQCSHEIVGLVEGRRHHWNMLRFLSGQTQAQLDAAHREELGALKAKYDQALEQRETSLDDIAKAMADLVSSSRTPGGRPATVTTSVALPTPTASAAPAAADATTGATDKAIWLDPADEHLCNDCGTCYQELPQFFRKKTDVVDGEAKILAQFIPGSLDGVEITADLAKRIARVKDTCDAEIIR
jgi:pyruvate-ferredoxin/flavodoxin oxidoreductase